MPHNGRTAPEASGSPRRPLCGIGEEDREEDRGERGRASMFDAARAVQLQYTVSCFQVTLYVHAWPCGLPDAGEIVQFVDGSGEAPEPRHRGVWPPSQTHFRAVARWLSYEMAWGYSRRGHAVGAGPAPVEASGSREWHACCSWETDVCERS